MRPDLPSRSEGTALPVDTLFSPPPELAGLVHLGLVKTLPGGSYILPAGLQPIFLVILEGRILVQDEGETWNLARISLCGGTRAIQRAWAAPGTRILTLSVRPGQLRRLVDFPALAIMEDWLAFDDFLTGEERGEAARCEAAIVDSDDPARQVEAFFRFLSDLGRRRGHVGADLALPEEFLSLPPKELAARFDLGQRQFERRFLASYGQPLRSYRQQLRCSRMMATVVCGRARIESWADLAADFGYCDQSHLHHDLVRFTGYTPGQLAAGIASDDPAFWPYRISPQLMVRLFGPSGY